MALYNKESNRMQVTVVCQQPCCFDILQNCKNEFETIRNTRCRTRADYLRISERCHNLQERVNALPHSPEKENLLLEIAEKLQNITIVQYVFERQQVIDLIQNIIGQTRGRSIFSEAYQRTLGMHNALQRAITAHTGDYINMVDFLNYHKPNQKNILLTMEAQTWYWHDRHSAHNSTFRLLVDRLNELASGLGTMIQSNEQARIQEENRAQQNRRANVQVAVYPFGVATMTV